MLIASCGNKEKKTSSANKQDISTEADSAKEIEINPLMGYWISRAYNKELLDNLSPYKCSRNINGITELWINEKMAKVVFNNAEGQDFNYVNEAAEKYTLKLSDNLSIIYNGDNKAIIKNGKERNDLIKSEKPYGNRTVLEQFVVSHLFVGEYITNNGKVVFNEDGSLTGLDKYLTYKVYTSFEELSDFDLIEFRDVDGKADYKAWEIQDDILILYNIVPGEAYVFGKGKEWLRLKLSKALS